MKTMKLCSKWWPQLLEHPNFPAALPKHFFAFFSRLKYVTFFKMIMHAANNAILLADLSSFSGYCVTNDHCIAHTKFLSMHVSLLGLPRGWEQGVPTLLFRKLWGEESG